MFSPPIRRATLFIVLAATQLAAQMRGVNLAGAEFGQSSLPGVYNHDYTFNSELSYRYFAARNLGLIRLPLQWERLQTSLRAPLDPGYLALLKTAIAWAKADGARVILDIHNFGYYSMTVSGKLTAYAIDQSYSGSVRVTRADLVDLWTRLSQEFASEPTVYAYDLMNEPHFSNSNSTLPGWNAISQAVLTAIRDRGDNKLIMIPGNSWSSANRWVSVHGQNGWITDPADNFMYEAHLYFDSDESGTYVKTYDTELAANPALATIGTARVSKFIAWCQSNNARCYLGEFGVPVDPRWLAVLDDFLKTLDAAGIDGTIWAAGEWWGASNLSTQPTGNFMLDRPQISTLLGHLPAGTFTSVSAAGSSGSTFAPESYMAGYGQDLAGGSVELTDAADHTFSAPLVFVSSGQINYLLPAGIASGRLKTAVLRNGAVVATGSVFAAQTAPYLFTFEGSATGTAAAVILRFKADGTQAVEFTSQPVRFGDTSERLFLSLYGTGFRNAAAPAGATVRVGNTTLPILYIGAQPDSPGLDQLNVELPRSLAGAGQLVVTFTVDGKTANPVTVTFQ